VAVKVEVMSMNQTETCELPKNWQCVRLGEHIKKPEYGYTTHATKKRKGLKILRISDIQKEQVDWELVPYCECDDVVRQKYLLKPGDILVARIGATTGKTFLAQDRVEAIFASYLIRIRPRSDLLPRFLSYFFQSRTYWDQISQHKGARLKGGISVPILENLKIPLPPLAEQEVIAKILQVVDGAKKARVREIELERERKAALIEHLFTHGNRGELTKQTQIGKMPSNWQPARLSEFSERPVYGFTTSALTGPGETKLLRITDIQEEKVVWDAVPYCACDDETRQRYILKTGDLLIARIGATTGKTYLVDDAPTAIFASYLIRIRTGPDLLPTFLSFYFQTDSYWMQIDQSKGGRLKGGINIPVLESLIIPLPPLMEQTEISDILQACNAKISTLETEIKLLNELFAAMLEELMTGKLYVKPVEEVAAA
jgi:type I restriction enzyme S subunit